MNHGDWLAANNRYLAASLHWLHLRLKQRLPLVPGVPAEFPVPVSMPVPTLVAATAAAPRMPSRAVLSMPMPGLAQARSWFSQRALTPAPVPAVMLEATPSTQATQATQAPEAAPANTPITDALFEAATARADAALIDPQPALLTLAARFGLSPFERDVLLLCVAAELDPAIGALFAAVQGGAAHTQPSFGLAFYLLDEPAWDALAPLGRLRGLRLVEVNQPGATPLTSSALRSDERIVNYVKGLNVLDERLALLLSPVGATSVLAASQQARVDEILLRLGQPTQHATAARNALNGGSGNAPGNASESWSESGPERGPERAAGPSSHVQPSQPSAPNPLPQGSTAPSPSSPSSHPAGVPMLASVATVQLLGTDPDSKLAVAIAVCAGVGRQLFQLGVDALPTPRAESEHLARLWQREACLLPVALFIDADALDSSGGGGRSGGGDAQAALAWFLAHPLGLVFVGVRDAALATTASSQVVEVGKPTAVEQCAAWRAELPADWPAEAATDSARLLAGQFDLGLADIRRAAQGNANTNANANAQAATTLSDIWDASRSLTRPRLDALAQRLDPRATWDDLVLSDESLDLLHQITTQLRNRYQVYEDWGFAARSTRGLGISALFAGESGTGKTMAAEVIANALRLNLYRIDLSAVVSKYIGETEKNLRRLFDAAEQGGAILFFDEADALFGKRSEVKDSEGKDREGRYANIEINHLLQRMESFSGLAILATHMKSALDPALLRRLRFAVNFPFPGLIERKAIWQKAWPAEVPCEGLDVERLARVGVSGGSIRNIALNAAFLAAQRGTPVTMPLLMAALRTELRKLGKPVNEAEFR